MATASVAPIETVYTAAQRPNLEPNVSESVRTCVQVFADENVGVAGEGVVVRCAATKMTYSLPLVYVLDATECDQADGLSGRQ